MEIMARSAGFGGAHPIVETNALLEGRRRRAHERAFVDADEAQCIADRRKGAFADADAADLVRRQQGDRQARVARPVEKAREICGGQPTRRAAADAPARTFSSEEHTSELQSPM